jgi:cation transporter-like permease
VKTKKEMAAGAGKTLYSGTGAAVVAGIIVSHAVPGLAPTESAVITGVLAGVFGSLYRLAINIAEHKFGINPAKYL